MNKGEKKVEMDLNQYQKEKNYFLRSAYEAAFENNPYSPFSVSLDPIEFGKSIGFDDNSIERIMTELISDGFVTSSIGMGMLMVTRYGLEYLTKIENEPMMAVPFENEIIQNNSKINSTFMKQSEKLDLILRELYKFKNDGRYYSIGMICQNLKIPIDSSIELTRLAHRLKEDGYIKAIFKHNDCNAELTTYGIEYCEEDSYSYSGYSVITNNYSVSVVNSPNANVVNHSSNVTITQNFSEANELIEKIRETISISEDIEKEKAEEILECLNEIQENIRSEKKPKYAIKSLIDISGGISSIASWVTLLGQFAGIIPIPM